MDKLPFSINICSLFTNNVFVLYSYRTIKSLLMYIYLSSSLIILYHCITVYCTISMQLIVAALLKYKIILVLSIYYYFFCKCDVNDLSRIKIKDNEICRHILVDAIILYPFFLIKL